MTGALAAVGVACSSGSGTAGSPPATLVTVNPSAFAGDVTCAALPGAWKTYVATLFDVTDPDREPFQLASSAPVPCNLPVSFAFVVPGHYYYARIDGYDRTDIVPDGFQDGVPSSGNPRMLDPATRLPVEPRWTTSCGKIPDLSAIGDADAGVDADPDASATDAFAKDATVCLLSTNVLVQHCAPLKDENPSGVGSITLDLALVRGALACGTAPGQIDHLAVHPDPDSKPTRACDESVLYPGLTPGVDYEFRVEAFEAGATGASWAAKCHATARDGVDMPAQCEPLSDKGAIDVDFAALLAESNQTCDPSHVVGYSAVLLGAAQQGGELACTANTTFNGLPSATYQIVVDAFDSTHQSVFTAFCDAAVKPGQSTTASCELAAAR